jgi:DNA-directed RNA polymerase specialized sigma24 family protein
LIQAMPPAQRRCAVLCLVVGASTKEAARSLGIAESTVRKQIERARQDLREELSSTS